MIMKYFHVLPLDTPFGDKRGVIINTGWYRKSTEDKVVSASLLLSVTGIFKRIQFLDYKFQICHAKREYWIRFEWIRNGWNPHFHVYYGIQPYSPSITRIRDVRSVLLRK